MADHTKDLADALERWLDALAYKGTMSPTRQQRKRAVIAEMQEMAAGIRAAQQAPSLTVGDVELPEPVAFVDERAIAWLGERSKTARITTTLQASKSPERPMALYTSDQLRAALAAQSAAQAEPVATLWREKNQNLYPGPSIKLTPAGEALPLGVLHNLYAASQFNHPAQWVDIPLGAIVNGRTHAERLEATGLECEAGKLSLCNDWVEFRRCFEHLADWVQARAALINQIARIDPGA